MYKENIVFLFIILAYILSLVHEFVPYYAPEVDREMLIREYGYMELFPFSDQLIVPQTYVWMGGIKLADFLIHACVWMLAVRYKGQFLVLAVLQLLEVVEYGLIYNYFWPVVPFPFNIDVIYGTTLFFFGTYRVAKWIQSM